jgi:hypothetical protein
VIAKVQTYGELIAPYAATQMTPAEYDDALQEVVDFMELRAVEIEASLGQQE